ncbi:D-alanine--D-alanine ligase family protein [Occallatibacter riparius]|uniref:D-alanine--D-alanine ligase n=1 Tax=Occallatibacter riparius TaxID=1002689 RepID=A0A9J7BUR4_9BACT|nr:D-alanine--D-alanine ligase family protein [Occallatibacter riparius]UWZ86368.1 D-alanine--D-alanine ligase [Occallatibacter riparius]
MAKKLRVGILFGGRSGEHEVSLLSAASVLKAIDRKKFDVVPIGITKQGHWLAPGDAHSLLAGDTSAVARRLRAGDPEATPGAKLLHEGIPTLMVPEPANGESAAKAALSPASPAMLDVVFPVLHGTFGEDGTIQGLFELAGIPYVGSGVLGSSAGMDKDVMKRLFAQAGLPIVKHVTILRSEWEKSPKKAIAQIEKVLKYPVFVKPANLGSSVGISKAHDRKTLGPALDEAAKYDRKLVIEQGVGGELRKGKLGPKARELEVAVLGNDDPKASVVGEIIPGKEFYDYEAKYLSEGSVPIIPAKLTRAESKQIREMAVAAFRACDLAGLARVDFLMEPSGKRRIYINEVNTLPGFTQISMYPKLWEATGVPYTELITRLIEFALERDCEKKRNSYSRDDK